MPSDEHLSHEHYLYELGPRLLATGRALPPLPLDATAHILRGIWDRAGFVGLNNGDYPVASLLVPAPLAESIALLIEQVTGRRSVARPVGGSLWVGVSGRMCVPWLEYLYGSASVGPEAKRDRARQLINACANLRRQVPA